MERSIVFIALFAALISVLGLIPGLTLGFGVPITAQTLGVMLAGCILGAWRGFLATLLFVAIAMIGLPVLSNGRTGLMAINSPTVGFFLGFPIAAFVTGLVMEQLRFLSVVKAGVLASLVGCVVVLYTFGIAGLSVMLDKSMSDAALLVGAFIPGDIIKAILAGFLASAIYNARPAVVFTRH